MLNIYAQSFLTATRTEGVIVKDVPPTVKPEKRRWRIGRKRFVIEPDKL